MIANAPMIIPMPIYSSETVIISSPYFIEHDGQFINLAAATKFQIEHFFGYRPRAKIGSYSYIIGPTFDTEKEAIDYVKNLIQKMEKK